MAREKISPGEARRAALAAQGFARSRPDGRVNAGHIRRVIDNLGLLQLDYVNVLVPAHLMVLFSRLGAYDVSRFHDLVYKRRAFIEQWAHEASIVPACYWPVLAHRREDYRPYANSPIMKLRNKSKYLSEVIELVSEKGPLTSHDLPAVKGPRRRRGDWHRSLPRWALEWHFGHGNVAVANRLPNFQRVYDLPERLLDPETLSGSLGRQEAERELLRKSAAACGIATLKDLADYFRMSPRVARPRIDELVEAGELNPVEVQGWRETAYLHRNASIPRSLDAESLLSPFDPVAWCRPRAERLFDFHYRIEIYVPAARRRWGYYVLPFLLGDRIVARVDLKADRPNSTLLVLAAYPEARVDADFVAEALAREFRRLADWLGLERIDVRGRAEFDRKVGAALP